RGKTPLGRPGLLLGIGDDAAAFEPWQRPVVVTTDAVVEGVHWRHDLIGADGVGHRLLAANLSDLAAMGAQPLYGFLNLGLRPETEVAWVDDFLDGLLGLAGCFGLTLAGGDVVRSAANFASLTAVGRAGPRLLRRSDAKAGQVVVVSGPLGDAGAYVLMSERGLAIDSEWGVTFRRAFHRPWPAIDLGRALADLESPAAMGAVMDLSDGLAIDLPRLCLASGLRAIVEADKLPVSTALWNLAEALDLPVWELAVRGGEDFGLLFTCPEETAAGLMRSTAAEIAGGLTVIGRVTEDQRVLIRAEGESLALPRPQFVHFGAADPR
ncbi:MAG: thiamine-phosphate kinase, partial [Proteobacteria bacterium]|nr:thiamine-phosphate kinase [Pseudomonadota bacterium]